MARHLDIADAVVAALNDHTFSQTFTAERKALPVDARDNLGTLLVSVLPSTFATEMLNQTRQARRYGVDIGIQKGVNPENLTAFDALFELIEEVANFFAMKRLDGLQAAQPPKIETVSGAEAGYATEHLDGLRLFTAVLRLTFLVTEVCT